MQKNIDTVKLLILAPSRNDAEELVNLLRNAGWATQAQFIESEQHFLELLNNKTWDLCFANNRSTEFTPQQAQAHIKKLELDIPTILLTEDAPADSIVAALESGIRDVIPQSEHQRLLLVSLRELDGLFQRRARRKAEIGLRDAEKRCKLLLDGSRDAIAYVHDGMHIYANRSYIELFGYQDFDELEGMPLMDMVAAKDQSALKERLRNYKDANDENNEFRCTGRKDDDSEFVTTLQLSSARYDAEPCTQILIRAQADNSQTPAPGTQDRDLLTGLQHQHAFRDSISQAIEKANQYSQKFAVFYIQLDDFIPLKNRLGVSNTNLMLTSLAKDLQQTVANPESLARIDEFNFALLVANITPEEALVQGEKICRTITTNQANLSDENPALTASVGISIINENTENPADVINKAMDAASFVKQNQQGDGAHLHSSDEQLAAHDHQVTQLLQESLNKQLFKILFQPVVSLRGDTTEHYEVLLRMHDENGEVIAPSEFLQSAKDNGMSRQIDLWVIEQSIKRLKSHLDKDKQIRILINITAESLTDSSLLPEISSMLNEARVPGNSIIFQISETDATAHMSETKEFIRGANELYCKAALTHFGRALNPFHTLKSLPVNYVKIDSSFITELVKEEDSKEELKILVSSLHTQGKLTIAPFVDSASLLPVLWQAGVNYIQGYYIQQPGNEMDYDFTTEDDD